MFSLTILILLPCSAAMASSDGVSWRQGPHQGAQKSTSTVLAALAAAVAALAVGSAVVYPFEMDTVVSLAGGRLVATHYGLYNTVSGLGITLGNLATGAPWDTAQRHGQWLTWSALAATGFACACAVLALTRSGRLGAPPPSRFRSDSWAGFPGSGPVSRGNPPNRVQFTGPGTPGARHWFPSGG